MALGDSELRIKYGLGRDPSESQIRQWAQTVRRLIQEGVSKESAGAIAAQRIFPDFRTRIYASEGDTIDTLLRLAEEKK